MNVERRGKGAREAASRAKRSEPRVPMRAEIPRRSGAYGLDPGFLRPVASQRTGNRRNTPLAAPPWAPLVASVGASVGAQPLAPVCDAVPPYRGAPVRRAVSLARQPIRAAESGRTRPPHATTLDGSGGWNRAQKSVHSSPQGPWKSCSKPRDNRVDPAGTVRGSVVDGGPASEPRFRGLWRGVHNLREAHGFSTARALRSTRSRPSQVRWRTAPVFVRSLVVPKPPTPLR